VADCPVRILQMAEAEPILPAADEPLCIACGHCLAVCPTAAVDHAEMAAQECPAVDASLALSADQAEQFLRSRRSIRQYRSGAVEPGLLASLLRLATYAPSGHNSQPVEWLVVSGAEAVGRLADLVRDWMRWVGQEQPQAFRAMRLDRVLEAGDRGEDRVLRGAPHLIIAHAAKENRFAPAAAMTALAYLELAAPSLGLGTCWAGYFTAAAAFGPLQAALALPEGHGVLGGAMVGRPAVRYTRLPLRREPRITWR
jgi:nitroreductase